MNDKHILPESRWSSLFREVVAAYGSVKSMADRLGCSRSAIYQWEGIPSERVPAIAEQTGIPASRLRPDIFG